MIYIRLSRLGKALVAIVFVLLLFGVDIQVVRAADRPPLPAKQITSQLPRLPFYNSLRAYNNVKYVVLVDDKEVATSEVATSNKIFNKFLDFVCDQKLKRDSDYGQKREELKNIENKLKALLQGATSSTVSTNEQNLRNQQDKLKQEIAAFEEHTREAVVQKEEVVQKGEQDFITFMEHINARETAIVLIAAGAQGAAASRILDTLKDKKDCLHSVVLFDPDVYQSFFGVPNLYNFNLNCIKHRLYNFYSKQRTLLYRKIMSTFDKENQWLKVVNICCFDLKNSYVIMDISADMLIAKVINAMTFIDKHYALNIDLSAVFIKGKDYPTVFINRALYYKDGRLIHEYADTILLYKKYVWEYPVSFDLQVTTTILDNEELLSYNEILSLPDQSGKNEIVKYNKVISDANSKIQKSPDIAALIKTYEGIYDFIYKDQSKTEAWGIWLAGKALNIPWLGDYIKKIVSDKIKAVFTQGVAADIMLNSFINKFKEQPDKLKSYKRNLNQAILGLRLGVYSSTQKDRICDLLNWVLNNQDWIPYFFAFETWIQDESIFLRRLGATDDLANQFKTMMTPQQQQKEVVRRGAGICEDEKNIVLSRRKDIIVPALNNMCSKIVEISPVTANDAPKIGIACSGGGYRAMIASLGFVHGLAKKNILSTVSYMTALSGSSWMLCPWIACQLKFPETYDDFVVRLRAGAQHFNESFSENELRDIASLLLTRYNNEGGITLVDFYGALLARALLKGFPNSGQTATLFNSIRINSLFKNYPFPIATAVGSTYEHYLGFKFVEAEDKKEQQRNYFWFEMSPVEIGCEYLNAWIDPQFSGCRFDKGMIIEFGPEVSLGTIMGIAGSAFAADIRVILSKSRGKIPSFLESFVQNLIVKRGGDAMKFLQSDQYPLGVEVSDIMDFRFASGRLINFAHGIGQGKMAGEKFINLFDSGIDFNLPVDPLLRRGVNLYLICDASANVKHQLAKVQQYVKDIDKGYKLPPMKLDTVANDEVSVFYDVHDVSCPVIVYVPNKVGMSTLQFNYDEHDFNMIYKTMMSTVERNSEKIIDAICLVTLNSKLQSTPNNEQLKQLRNDLVNKLSGVTVTSHGVIDIKEEHK